MKLLKRLFLALPCAALLCAALPAFAASVPSVPGYTVGTEQRVTIPSCGNSVWQTNDSTWPLVTLNDGSGVLTLLGMAQPFVYTGPDFFNLSCTGTNQTFTIAGAPKTFLVGQSVLASDGVTPQPPYPPGAYNSSGTWVQAGGYAPDGKTLVMLTHSEVHTFAQAGTVQCRKSDGTTYTKTTNQGEWNSSGLWTSTDNGKTWIDKGQISGIQIPAAPPYKNCGIGGGGMSTIVWDPVNNRWLGYGTQTPYVSYATIPVGGEWYGLDPTDATLTKFTVSVDPNMPAKPLLGVAGGLNSDVATSAIVYNTYLKMFVMAYASTGSAGSVSLRFSYDGINWSTYTSAYTAPINDPTTTPPSRYWLTYRGITGAGSSFTCAQDCYLTFMQGAPTASGNFVDFMVVPIHFN